MKKVIPTIILLLIFTLVFIFCFRSCASATGYGQGALEGESENIQNTTDNASTDTTENSSTDTTENGSTDTTENSSTDISDNTTTDTSDGFITEETPTLDIVEKIEEFDFKLYIQEKIIPVVIGVLTASSALIATLASISRSLGKMKDAKEEFKKEAGKREESFKAQSELLKTKAEELINIASEVPKLKKEIEGLHKNTEKLILECSYISQMISLGFGESKEVVKSGNGAKISRLECECNRLLKESEGVSNEKA